VSDADKSDEQVFDEKAEIAARLLTFRKMLMDHLDHAVIEMFRNNSPICHNEFKYNGRPIAMTIAVGLEAVELLDSATDDVIHDLNQNLENP
jgi:hypothetical protein